MKTGHALLMMTAGKLLQVICKEVHRTDMVIVENTDHVHITPMTILPVIVQMETDYDV